MCDTQKVEASTNELIKSVTADTLLIDKDGSEELLVEIGVKTTYDWGTKLIAAGFH